MRSVVVATLLAGCALTKQSEPVDIRYYTPAVATDAPASSHETARARVRLGRVTASSHLRYSIAQRRSPVELELYEFDRWTDTPDVYARRSLERALFQERPIEQATSGAAFTVDVDVIAFEEVASPHAGRVQLRYRLRDEHSVIATDVITVVRASRGARLADVAAAIGEALDAATAQIAGRVLTTLSRR